MQGIWTRCIKIFEQYIFLEGFLFQCRLYMIKCYSRIRALYCSNTHTHRHHDEVCEIIYNLANSLFVSNHPSRFEKLSLHLMFTNHHSEAHCTKNKLIVLFPDYTHNTLLTTSKSDTSQMVDSVLRNINGEAGISSPRASARHRTTGQIYIHLALQT
jgi:hypothetical protein